MFSWAAISLLLQPWTSSFNTCSSRCVFLLSSDLTWFFLADLHILFCPASVFLNSNSNSFAKATAARTKGQLPGAAEVAVPSRLNRETCTARIWPFGPRMEPCTQLGVVT